MNEPKPGHEAGEIDEMKGEDMRPVYEQCFQEAKKIAEECGYEEKYAAIITVSKKICSGEDDQ